VSKPSIGVAVIGAGMAGRAHANGYRSAPAVFSTDLPDVRLVAIADAHEPSPSIPRGGTATSPRGAKIVSHIADDGLSSVFPH
jgi:hypothetical protein